MTDRIFVTVGAQMHFDRLVGAVDMWSASTTRKVEVFAQVGPSEAPPANVEWTRSLGPHEFADRMRWADVVVSHAGMGTILSCLVEGVPLVLMPRRGDLMETRNDHQVGTIARFADWAGVTSAPDEDAVVATLESGDWSRPDAISPHASTELIATIRDFIDA